MFIAIPPNLSPGLPVRTARKYAERRLPSLAYAVPNQRKPPAHFWIIRDNVNGNPERVWQAAKARQGEISEQYATSIAATRAAHANRLNSTHRPRYLLSGLLECGVCGGSYAKRGQDRPI